MQFCKIKPFSVYKLVKFDRVVTFFLQVDSIECQDCCNNFAFVNQTYADLKCELAAYVYFTTPTTTE